MQLMYWEEKEELFTKKKKNGRVENTRELLKDRRHMGLVYFVFDRHQPFRITCIFTRQILCTFFVLFNFIAAQFIFSLKQIESFKCVLL